MRVLVVNAGSSSLKLTLLDRLEEVVAEEQIDPWEAGSEELRHLAESFDPPDAVGHRIVHGGETFKTAAVIDRKVRDQIDELTPLAPLHQPRAVEAIDTVGAVFPEVPAVACFDTAFHATIPREAATYAVPRQWSERWSLRRYGFHGLSHAYSVRLATELLWSSGEEAKVVSCHLGAGASLCAALDGRSVDTTMGFTPLEGLVMATRSGSVDPGLVLWLINEAGLEPREVRDVLESRSGLAGLTSGDGDMRSVLENRANGDQVAEAAFAVYVHRLVREIGAMAAVLGGIDALTFTGGVGENSSEVRAAAGEHLGHLGVALDTDRNTGRLEGRSDISAQAAPVKTLVIQAREDLEIARQTRELLEPEASGQSA